MKQNKKLQLPKGRLHPITQFYELVFRVFQPWGFEVLEGFEIEDEWHNFDALRIPDNHPARDEQDTFWLDKNHLLRTHTSAMQIRALRELGKKPPLRILSPGKVYRNEATDASHEAVFFQLEGFVIEKGTSMARLIWTLKTFLKQIYGRKTIVRFRPHHYPFVEPGMDVDMFWKGKWLEVLGSGMIHPQVIGNMGLDPKNNAGYAFGMGIDRLMMLYYGIDDIRASFQNDLRFLKQF